MPLFQIGDEVVGKYGTIKDNIGKIVKFGGCKFQEQNYMVKFNNMDEPCECIGSSLNMLKTVRDQMNKK